MCCLWVSPLKTPPLSMKRNANWTEITLRANCGKNLAGGTGRPSASVANLWTSPLQATHMPFGMVQGYLHNVL